MKGLMCTALIALAIVTAAAEETKLGAGVTLKESTAINALASHPDQYVGKTVRIDGIATAVCENMGCWLSVAADDQPDAKVIRLKVDDGVIVFPVTAKGKRVSAEGVFEEVNATEQAAAHAKHDAHGTHDPAKHATQAKHDPAQHAAHANDPSHTSKKYQIKATGAVIK